MAKPQLYVHCRIILKIRGDAGLSVSLGTKVGQLGELGAVRGLPQCRETGKRKGDSWAGQLGDMDL